MSGRVTQTNRTPKLLFQARHYGSVATTLRNAYGLFTDDASRTAITWMKAQFIEQFKQDNPNFDLERFMKACNPEDTNG